MISATYRRFCLRVARVSDSSALSELAQMAMRDIVQIGYTEHQQSAIPELAGVEDALIRERTYYVCEVQGQIVASGGWSLRNLLHPGSEEEAFDGVARVRGMYTHPDFARRGLGRLMLQLCETSARLAGVQDGELLATPTGSRLYLREGWVPIEEVMLSTSRGTALSGLRMRKSFIRPVEVA